MPPMQRVPPRVPLRPPSSPPPPEPLSTPFRAPLSTSTPASTAVSTLNARAPPFASARTALDRRELHREETDLVALVRARELEPRPLQLPAVPGSTHARRTRGYSRVLPAVLGVLTRAAPRPLRSLCAAAVLAASGGLDGVLSAPAPTACVLISRDARSGYYDYCYGVLARTHSRGTHGRPDARTAAQSRPCARRRRSRRRRAETQSRAPATQTCGRHARPMYEDRPTPA